MRIKGAATFSVSSFNAKKTPSSLCEFHASTPSISSPSAKLPSLAHIICLSEGTQQPLSPSSERNQGYLIHLLFLVLSSLICRLLNFSYLLPMNLSTLSVKDHQHHRSTRNYRSSHKYTLDDPHDPLSISIYLSLSLFLSQNCRLKGRAWVIKKSNTYVKWPTWNV